jgi:hypothetical protein
MDWATPRNLETDISCDLQSAGLRREGDQRYQHAISMRLNSRRRSLWRPWRTKRPPPSWCPGSVGHRTMIPQWKRALLEGASGVFERGGRNKPELVEGQGTDAAPHSSDLGGPGHGADGGSISGGNQATSIDRSDFGVRFEHATLHYLLTNPVYAGRIGTRTSSSKGCIRQSSIRMSGIGSGCICRKVLPQSGSRARVGQS